MNKKSALCLAFAGLAAVAAHADPIGYYGNTLLIKRATGQGEMVYRPDNTFTLKPVVGDIVHGTWSVQGGKMCLKPQTDLLKPFCVPDDPVHKVGDSWNVRTAQGEEETLTIVAGQK